MYPGWPDKGRDKQGGQIEQKSERALGVSSHDEEHCGEQPVVAWINILLSGWEERLKTSKDWLGVIKDYGSYQLLQNFMYARNQEKTNKKNLDSEILSTTNLKWYKKHYCHYMSTQYVILAVVPSGAIPLVPLSS